MKKIISVLILVLCMAVLCSCGSTAVQNPVENVSAQVDEAAIAEEEAKAAEEAAKAEEEAKKAEEAKAAEEAKVAEEAKKAEEAKAAEEAQAEQDNTLSEADQKLYSGLDEKVDFSKITRYDEKKTMYTQRGANIRKGPSTDFDKVGYFDTNIELSVIGCYEEKGWYLIEYGETCAFISNRLADDNKVDLDALKAQAEAESMAKIQAEKAAQEAAAQAANQAPAQETQQQAAAPQATMPAAGILFIGDSRCVQMREAVGGGNSSWICENAKGYNWLAEKAIGQADQCVGKGTKVVICLGVNDTGNAGNYAALVNQKAAEWAGRGAKTYFVSVNPVWENPWVTEDQVINFNSYIAGQLSGVRYIDTHSWLAANGYYLVDGLHYDTATYINIFNLIVGSL